MFQDGPNSRRSRPPRVFHSTLQYYCEYSKEESELVSLLEQVSTNYLNL